MLRRGRTILILVLMATATGCQRGQNNGERAGSGGQISLLNVSYSPTVELYQGINKVFAADWKARTGQTVTIHMSHGGSGKQAQAVISGLEADVVTLALASDIDAIADQSRLLPADWQSRLPDNSSPYTSTIVLMVRQGNPKHIKDWDDLVRPGISVITPNPKVSGGARWNFLAAWGYELHKSGGNEEATRNFVERLFKNVPVLDSGARGATDTFVERGIGDVLIAWENEALLALKTFGRNKFEIVYPSESILAEPPVAVVDRNSDRHGTRQVAEAYLKFLYTEKAQTIIAENYYRPRMASVASRFSGQFPTIKLFTIDQAFGGWRKAQEKYFSDGGIFDQIYGMGH